MKILRWIDRKLNEWWARDLQRQFDKELVKVKVKKVGGKLKTIHEKEIER